MLVGLILIGKLYLTGAVVTAGYTGVVCIVDDSKWTDNKLVCPPLAVYAGVIWPSIAVDTISK